MKNEDIAITELARVLTESKHPDPINDEVPRSAPASPVKNDPVSGLSVKIRKGDPQELEEYQSGGQYATHSLFIWDGGSWIIAYSPMTLGGYSVITHYIDVERDGPKEL